VQGRAPAGGGGVNYGLTSQQSNLLKFISRHCDELGFCPSYRQMMDAIGLKSLGGIARLIAGLEERGLIRRLPNRRRSIELLERNEPEFSAIELRNALAQYSTLELRRELVRRQEGASA